MTTPFQGSVALKPGYRFQWEEAQKQHVLLYPEGMITLNDSAAEILKRCDGSRDEAAIVQDLNRQFPDVDLAADVHEFLEIAHERGWIRFL
ncbi:MAG: pyrroloquinoline quinone biosynthesis peptide chaperone PqqD [Candidatus Competibacterales bacterium]